MDGLTGRRDPAFDGLRLRGCPGGPEGVGERAERVLERVGVAGGPRRESEARDVEEGTIAGEGEVDPASPRRVAGDAARLLEVVGEALRAHEVVRGAGRHDREAGAGPARGRRDIPERAVATGDHDPLEASARELSDLVDRAAGQLHVGAREQLRHALRLGRAGARVLDQENPPRRHASDVRGSALPCRPGRRVESRL